MTTQKNVSEVGKEMCENINVRKVTFTGSTAVAKMLYAMASGTMKKYDRWFMSTIQDKYSDLIRRVSLEAGGNSPFIVFDDADIDAAVEGEPQTTFNISSCVSYCI